MMAACIIFPFKKNHLSDLPIATRFESVSRDRLVGTEFKRGTTMHLFARLFLLFTFVPIIELILLIKLGGYIGALETIAIVLITGIIGAYLAKHEGFRVMMRIQQELSQGRIPAEELLDGVIILAGGLLLLTPGLLTDVVGLLAMIPVSRRAIKKYLRKKFQQKINSGQVYTTYTREN